MEKRVLHHPDMAEPVGYVYGVRVDGAKSLLYLAGQVPQDKDGNVVGVGDIKAQSQQVFANMARVLAAGGATLQDVVKITVFLTDGRLSPGFREARTEVFGDKLPASTMVIVSGLSNPLWLVEVEAVAVVG